MAMNSSRPYLIRALYEWILDNDCTPYVLVDAEYQGVDVPDEYVKDGQIVLNIAPTAVSDILISNESLQFNARFAGVAREVFVPIGAALGVYARENGQGMLFESEAIPAAQADTKPQAKPVSKGDRPHLKLVK
jgi:stringent starvation protein B